MSEELVKVATVAEVPAGGGRLVETEGIKIALFNVGGEIYAIADTCTHAGGPLSAGALEGESVQCPWHGARFDVRTGTNLTPPAMRPVHSFKVEIRGDDVYIALPSL